MSATRRHAADLAVVVSPRRVALLDLARPAAPPVVLSGTAADIWAAIDGVRDDDATCARVAQAYGMEVEQVRADVFECLTSLESLGLLVQINGGTG